MVTGFDLLGHSKAYQEHWARRLVATIIDIIIIFLPIWIFAMLLNVQNAWLVCGVTSGVAWFIYSGVLEGLSGKTIGKYAMELKVVPLSGHMDISKSFVRNVPKIFWVPFLFIDWLLGLATEGDPRQRFSDRIMNTTVVQSPLPTPPESYPGVEEKQAIAPKPKL